MEDSESDISFAEAKKQRENFTEEEWPTHRRSRGDGTCWTIFIPRCAKETRFIDVLEQQERNGILIHYLSEGQQEVCLQKDTGMVMRDRRQNTQML